MRIIGCAASLVVALALTLSVSSVSTTMTGGWQTQDASDPAYMEKAWKSMKGVNDNASNNGPYHFIPIKVLSAKTQVVAGVNHEFEVLIGESECKKGDVSFTELDAANCKLRDEPQRHVYKVKLWEKPWENFEQYDVEKVRTVDASEKF